MLGGRLRQQRRVLAENSGDLALPTNLLNHRVIQLFPRKLASPLIERGLLKYLEIPTNTIVIRRQLNRRLERGTNSLERESQFCFRNRQPLVQIGPNLIRGRKLKGGADTSSCIPQNGW